MDQPFAATSPALLPDAPAAPPEAVGDPGAIPEIEHYELDGIPLYHLPAPGQTILSLSFRVGRGDEPVAQGGLTHLAEHLVLTPIDGVFDHSNGTTEAFRVTFVTAGRPAEVSKFLRNVCESIERPRLSRMFQEANVLRTEAAGRSGMGLSLRSIWYRTGYQGIGNMGLPEFFLDRLDEEVLRSWWSTHLVAGNAVIWIAGQLPDDLEVILPPGPRTPPPEQRWIDGLNTPTAVREEAPGVAVSFFVRRTFATTAGFRALNRQLTKRLRVDRGLGYEIGGDYLPIGVDDALATAWVTCLPNAVRDVEIAVLEAIDDLAARGPNPDELSRDYQDFIQGIADPRSAPGRLDAHARDVLLGHDPAPMTSAESTESLWRLESEHVAAAVRDARDSMLLLLPEGGVDPQRPLKRYPRLPADDMRAERIFAYATKAKRRFRPDVTVVHLAVGNAGVSVDTVEGRRLAAVRWSDCVAVVGGTTKRSILSRDGSAVEVFASDWNDGSEALRLIDRLTPAGLAVRQSG